MIETSISRRRILKSSAGAVGALSLSGVAAADEPKRYNVGIQSPAAERAAQVASENIHRVFDWENGTKTISGRFSEKALEHLRKRPNVRYVEEDDQMRALDQTLPWGIDRVDAEIAHAHGETGGDDTNETTGDDWNGADIAIVDSGIDSDHPDLQANLGEGKSFVECTNGANECRYTWDDDLGHGTHCAGIADAIDDSEGVVGVSTDARLHAVKVLDDSGRGAFSDVAAGIRWVADQDYDVASMSLGGGKTQVVEDAVEYAYERGVLLVGAAGNSGPCSDCVGYPAAEPEVIAVSATSKDDTLATFSSTGPQVDLAAPGENIYSTYTGGEYETLNGTSMACPHVSGTGAQLMDNGHSNTEARDVLEATAEDIGLGPNEQGYGLLDVAAALDFDSSDDLGDSDGGDTNAGISTTDATNVGETSARLNGSLDDLGGASSAECYFEYRASSTSTWNTTTAQTLSTTGAYSQDISELSSSTEYKFRAVADASDGDTDTGSTLTFTTSRSGSSDTAPTIDNYVVAEANSPNPHAEITADWAVSDTDGDLDTVLVEVFDAGSGSKVDSSTTTVSGSDATGTDKFQLKHADGETFDVTLTVEDASGKTVSSTRTVSE